MYEKPNVNITINHPFSHHVIKLSGVTKSEITKREVNTTMNI